MIGRGLGLKSLVTWSALCGVLGGCGGGGAGPADASSTNTGGVVVVPPVETDWRAKLLGKVKASMSAAELSNASTNAPMSETPVWDSQSIYKVGDVVRGTGDSSQHRYICVGVSGEPDSNRRGPSGTSLGKQNDGYAIWYYHGPVRPKHSDSVPPTITWGVQSELLKDMVGYQVNVPTISDPKVAYSGGLLEVDPNMGNIAVGVFGGNSGLPKTPLMTTPASSAMTFWTRSDQIVLGSYNAIYRDQRFVLEINDRRISDGIVHMEQSGASPAFFNSGGVKIDFTATPLKGQRKKIRIWSMDKFGALAHSIYVESGQTINVEANPNRWSVAVEGDSITQGGLGTPYQPGMDWVSQVARLVGADSAANMAQGGTGFISNGFGAKTTYLERLDRLVQLKADVYVIAGNHNDQSYTDAQQIEAALTYLKRLRTLQPQSIVIVTGVLPLKNEDMVSVKRAEQNLKAAFDQWNDGNAYFLPVSTDPAGAWLNGTEEAFYDWAVSDGHLIQRGVDHVAGKYAGAIKNILKGL